MKLNEGRAKHFYKVLDIEIESALKKRIQEMGITNGSVVKVMSQYSNNALILNVRGSRIVLGKDITKNINVELVDCPYKDQPHRKTMKGMGCGRKMNRGQRVCK